MEKSKLIKYAFINSLGTFIYVVLVALLMQNGQNSFGPMQNSILGPIAFLLLFVVSATIVGLLVLGRPGYLYFNGFKREGLVWNILSWFPA